MMNPISAIQLAPPKGIPTARSNAKTRRKTMETTIPNTENTLAVIQYSLEESRQPMAASTRVLTKWVKGAFEALSIV
jgi:hypothetical protein